MKDKIVFLYVTCSSEEEAQKIGEALLKERLCACVNIYPQITSMYWWEEKIEKSVKKKMIKKNISRAGILFEE